MDARTLFLAEHAMVHTSAVTASGGLHLPEGLLAHGPEVLLAAPAGLNSIAWLTWHMARTEDVAVNGVLRHEAPIFERDGWNDRLGIDAAYLGTGDTTKDVARFNDTVSLDALKGYRDAVGIETRLFVGELDFATLTTPLSGGGRGTALSAFGPNAGWVEEVWEGQTGLWFLTWLSVGHNYLHLGEAGVVSRALGLRGR